MSLLKKFMMGVLVSIIPLFYLGMYYDQLLCNDKLKIKYGLLTTVLPIVYGITYVLLDLILPLGFKFRLFVIGALFGIIFSIIGRFWLDLPTLLFQTKNPDLYHLYSILIYSPVFGLGIPLLTQYIDYTV